MTVCQISKKKYIGKLGKGAGELLTKGNDNLVAVPKALHLHLQLRLEDLDLTGVHLIGQLVAHHAVGHPLLPVLPPYVRISSVNSVGKAPSQPRKTVNLSLCSWLLENFGVEFYYGIGALTVAQLLQHEGVGVSPCVIARF